MNNKNYNESCILAKEYQKLVKEKDKIAKKYIEDIGILDKKQKNILAKMRIALNVKEEVYPEMYR